MKHFIFFFLFYLLLFRVFGQEKGAITIQYIALKDTILIKEIEKLIQEEVNRVIDTTTTDKVYTENFFKKGLGYVNVNIEDNMPGKYFQDGDTIARYHLYAALMSFRKESLETAYPPFYSYVGGRLVLVYMPLLENVADLKFSEKSKKKLRKRVDGFLEKTKSVTFYNKDGSVAFRDKHHQIDYFRLHSGKYIYILKNKPPIIVHE